MSSPRSIAAETFGRSSSARRPHLLARGIDVDREQATKSLRNIAAKAYETLQLKLGCNQSLRNIAAKLAKHCKQSACR